jgi:hypothetical protein
VFFLQLKVVVLHLLYDLTAGHLHLRRRTHGQLLLEIIDYDDPASRSEHFLHQADVTGLVRDMMPCVADKESVKIIITINNKILLDIINNYMLYYLPLAIGQRRAGRTYLWTTPAPPRNNTANPIADSICPTKSLQ